MPRIARQSNARSSTNSNIPVKYGANGRSAWDTIGSVHMLLYGESRTGKTTLWATFPGPILALVCSGGIRPGELKSIDTPEYRRKIDARVVSSTEQLRLELAEADKFETVVLDHVSGLQDLKVREILGLEETPLSLYRPPRKRQSWSLVSQSQWGQIAVEMREVLRDILGLSRHVVIVAQQRVFGGNDDGALTDLIAPTVGASMIPSVVGWLNPACDYVVQTFLRPRMVNNQIVAGGKTTEMIERGKGVEFCLRCEPHNVYMTKFRLPLGRELPDVIINPTYDKIQKVIKGEALGLVDRETRNQRLVSLKSQK